MRRDLFYRRIRLGIFIACALALPGSLIAAASAGPSDSASPFRSPRSTIEHFVHFSERGDYARAADALSLPENTPQTERVDAARKLHYLLRLNKLSFSDIPDSNAVRESGITDYAAGRVVERTLSGSEELGEILLAFIPEKNGWYFANATLSRIDEWYERVGPSWLEQRLPQVFFKTFLDITLWQYILLLFYIFLGFIARRITVAIILSKFKKWAESSSINFNAALIEIATHPAGALAMALVWWTLIRIIGLPGNVFSILNTAAKAALIYSVVWLFYRFADVIGDYLRVLSEKTDNKIDDQLVPIVRKSLKTFIVIIGALFILQNFNVDVWSLLAGLGLGGLAFALAAQDTVKNLFGSMMIFVDRPFRVNDFVTLNGVSGTIEDVGFRSTRIRTLDKTLVTIPNASVANMNIENVTARPGRRIVFSLGVEYNTSPAQMEAFIAGIKSLILSNDKISHEPGTYNAFFNEFGASSLNILIFYWTVGTDYAEMLENRQWLNLEMMKLAYKLGIGFAFPTQTLHIETLAASRAPVDADAVLKIKNCESENPLPKGFAPQPPYFVQRDAAQTSANGAGADKDVSKP